MPFRLAAAFAAPLLFAGAALATADAAPRRMADATPDRNAADPPGKERGSDHPTARERKKNCIAEWREMSAAEKTSAGPKWPQFYNKCVKRQKGRNS